MHGLYYYNGLLINLDAPGEGQTVAMAINNAGQIVGYNMLPYTNGPFSTSIPQAILFNDGSPITLNPGTNYSVASGINNRGQIAGVFAVSNDVIHAFIYQDGLMTDLAVC